MTQRNKNGYGYAVERGRAVFRAMLETPEVSAETMIAIDRAFGTDLCDAALAAADRTFAATLALVTGERTAKAATASAWTRAIRADGAPAVRYADRKEVTGALVTLKMRVRARSGAPATVDRPVQHRPDANAGRMEAARRHACGDLRAAIASFRSGGNGAAKDAARGKIRAILHTWDGDAIVRDAAIAAGWRV